MNKAPEFGWVAVDPTLPPRVCRWADPHDERHIAGPHVNVVVNGLVLCPTCDVVDLIPKR